MADDATVSGYPQAKSVPCRSSFVAPDKGFPAGERAQDKKNSQPPVGRNDVVHLHQDSRRHGKNSSILRHELRQLRDHEGDENRDEGSACEGKECWINQRLLHSIAQAFLLHQVFH